jgi:hypothetical protein
MKDLNINGKIYARYEMDGSRLFLKVIIPIVRESERKSEDLLIHIIQLVEDRKFHSVSYLNLSF